MVLGHRVSRCGSCMPDLAAAEHGSWVRWLSGGGSVRNSSLPLEVRVADAQKVCWPAFAFRGSWWQWKQDVATRVNRAQRKILMHAMAFWKEDSETWEEFSSRRSRQCSFLQAKLGFWKIDLAARSLSWGEHVKRNHANSWPGHLVKVQNGLWLRGSRIRMLSASVWAGATGTRASPGRPSTRWEDGQVFCAELGGWPLPVF